MNRLICLTLLSFTACDLGDSVEPRGLADMPDLELTFWMYFDPPRTKTRSLNLEIAYDEQRAGECYVLHESFRARVGEREMGVTHPGSSDDTECRFPQLTLDAPQPADSLVLVDYSKQITIPLGTRVPLLKPQQPWTAKAGETARVPYAPTSALPNPNISLVLGPHQDRRTVPFSVESGEIVFQVPDVVGTGEATLWLGGSEVGPVKSWPCEGAKCSAFAGMGWYVPFEIQPAPM